MKTLQSKGSFVDLQPEFSACVEARLVREKQQNSNNKEEQQQQQQQHYKHEVHRAAKVQECLAKYKSSAESTVTIQEVEDVVDLISICKKFKRKMVKVKKTKIKFQHVQ